MKLSEYNILQQISEKCVNQATTTYGYRYLQVGDIFSVESALYDEENKMPFAIINVKGYGHLDCPMSAIWAITQEVWDCDFLVTGFKIVTHNGTEIKMPILVKL